MKIDLFVHPINLPPERMVFIEFYYPGKINIIGREFGRREDSNSYDPQIESILFSESYRDLLKERIVVIIKSYVDDKVLYLKVRNPSSLTRHGLQ